LYGLSKLFVFNALVQVSYLNFERQRLPDELMKADMQKHTGLEIDRQDIEVQVIADEFFARTIFLVF